MSTSSFAVRGRVIALEPDRPGPDAGRGGAGPEMARRVRRVAWIVALLLALSGTATLASGGWIHAKAWLAQRLIASAWTQARATGIAPAPWPWADTRPIARLTVAARGIEHYVLEGASGRSLAFGPGHLGGTAAPGSMGHSVLLAHRDTHFAFLKDLQPGDEIAVEDARGRVSRYRVRDMRVVDRADSSPLDPEAPRRLTLITCYPFDAVRPGTPLRYVVVAERV